MRIHLTICSVLSVFVSNSAFVSAESWIFRPSYFTHSQASGERVAQYQPEAPAILRCDPTYQESGYSHREFNLGDDHQHIVQTWGEGAAIRPYGEWEYPFRAGATPFGPWGNPQGPWTTPFDSWQNPYGLSRQPNGPFSQGFGSPNLGAFPGQYPGQNSLTPFYGGAAGAGPAAPHPGSGPFMGNGFIGRGQAL